MTDDNIFDDWRFRWSLLYKTRDGWKVWDRSDPELFDWRYRPLRWWSPRDLIRLPLHWWWARRYFG